MKTIIIITLGIICLLLLPFTALWAFVAAMLGYNYPLQALKGEDFEEAFKNTKKEESTENEINR